MKKIIAAALSVLLLSVHADEKILKYEKLLEYEGVSITRITPSSIRIIHSGGATTIPFDKLPQSVRENLGLTEEAAKKHRDKLMVGKKAADLKSRKRRVIEKYKLSMTGRVSQVLTKGLLLNDVRYTDGSKVERKIRYKVKVGGPTALYPNRKTRYEYRYKSEWVLKVKTSGVVFVECETSGFVDDSTFGSAVFSNGTFTYETVLGAAKTIRAYTTDPSAILKRNGL